MRFDVLVRKVNGYTIALSQVLWGKMFRRLEDV